MKKTTLMVIVATMLVLCAGTVMADIFEYAAPVKWSQKKLNDGSYLITLDGQLNIPDGVLYVYHQDNMRGRSVKKQKIEPSVFTVNHKEWVVDPFTTKIGQVMFNLYSPGLGRWSGIPNCLVALEEGLLFGDSYPPSNAKPTGAWDEPGGTGIVITASGIPVQYPVDNSGCYEAPRKASVPAEAKKHSHVRKNVIKKIPCPDGRGICSQPCIVEIREGVEYLVQSVGMWTRDEPVEERTLQQKARITLDSLGKPDKDDPADEKTVQQKTRKTLKKTKAIKKSLGEPKDGKTSAHEKLDALQSDVSLIKAEVIKTGGHTLPPAGTSKAQPSCSTVGCHVAPK